MLIRNGVDFSRSDGLATFLLSDFPNANEFLKFPSITQYLGNEDTKAGYVQQLVNRTPQLFADYLGWLTKYQRDLASLLPPHIINLDPHRDSEMFVNAHFLTSPTVFFGNCQSSSVICYPKVLAHRNKDAEFPEGGGLPRDEHGGLGESAFKDLWGDLVFNEDAHRIAETLLNCLDQVRLRSLIGNQGLSGELFGKGGGVTMSGMVSLGDVFFCECCELRHQKLMDWESLVRGEYSSLLSFVETDSRAPLHRSVIT